MATSATKTWILIPGYNEEKYLAQVLQKVKHFSKNVVYVDDGSSDRTVQIARRSLDHVLEHSMNLGKGAALKTGCEYIFHQLHADAVIFMDSDDQHDPAEIPEFIRLLEGKNQIVFGVRKFSSASMPLLRFLGNKIASAGLATLFGTYIPDIPSGYKALTKRAYQKLQWKSTGYEVEMEIAAKVAKLKLPFAIHEIETIYHDEEKGMNLLEALKIFKSLIEWRVLG